MSAAIASSAKSAGADIRTDSPVKVGAPLILTRVDQHKFIDDEDARNVLYMKMPRSTEIHRISCTVLKLILFKFRRRHRRR